DHRNDAAAERAGRRDRGCGFRVVQRCQPGIRQPGAAGDDPLHPRADRSSRRAGDRQPRRHHSRGGVPDRVLMGSQKGQAIVLIALVLTIVIGMAAIAIDGSRAYALRRDMQAAVDASSLAAGDKLQQTGSWTSAEQAAANIFASNLRLYAGPSCSGWGSPGAAPFTVSCTYSDGTVLTEVAQALGPQGGAFTVSAQRNLQLQFGRILTNGTSPTIAAISTGNVNNQRYTPAFGALSSA